MAENNFPHVEFIKLDAGPARLTGGGSPDPRVVENQSERAHHSNKVKEKIGEFTISRKMHISISSACRL